MRISFQKRLLILWGAFFLFWPLVSRAAEFQNAPIIERIKTLYASESARIGKKDPNPLLTKKRLEESAKGITNEEMEWLSQTALNAKESGDQRVFSVFFLALNGSDLAIAKLRAIGLSPGKPSAIEKEVREQAIKGLGKSKNPRAREALLEIETDQADASLQDRAHQALYEFENGRPEPPPILKSKKKK